MVNREGWKYGAVMVGLVLAGLAYFPLHRLRQALAEPPAPATVIDEAGNPKPWPPVGIDQ
jgi:hypothetical protein